MDTWHERSPEKSLLWIEGQIVSGQEAKYLETLRYLLTHQRSENPLCERRDSCRIVMNDLKS